MPADLETEAVALGARVTRVIQDMAFLPEDDAEAILLPLTGDPVPPPVYESLLDMLWPEVPPEEASEALRPWVERFNRLRSVCVELVEIRWWAHERMRQPHRPGAVTRAGGA